VFVLRPAGFLQKAISGVSNKFFKEEFKFKVNTYDSYSKIKALSDELKINLIYFESS